MRLKLAIVSLVLLAGCAKTTTETPVSGALGCISTTSPFGGGKGTAANPYLVCSLAHLQKTTDPDYSSSTFYLDADLDVSTLNPLGSFAGTFDGSFHTLSNYNNNDALYQSNSGTIRNLTIHDFQVTGNTRMGALVGTNESTGTLSKITVSGNLGFVYAFAYHAGGLVGYNQGTVEKSTSAIPVTAQNYAGGLVGFNAGTIQKSSATGPVQSNRSGGIGGSEGGGLAGANGSTAVISNSFAKGQVTVTLNNAGGFVGLNEGNLSNNFSTGRPSGGGSGIGGLVGTNSGGSIVTSYWDTTTSTVGTSAGGVGYTTAQMQVQGNYSGWDFVTVWNPPNASYPSLR